MLTTTPAQVVLTDAAQAAIQAAATNASTTGVKSSEFWVSVGAATASALAVGFLGAATGGILGAILTVGAAAYAHSRGNVKAAALAGASAGLAAAASSSNTTAQAAGKLGGALVNNIVAVEGTK